MEKEMENLLKSPEGEIIILKDIPKGKYWCNNWRKINKLPMRRKGFSIKMIKMGFEHKTTKKQKRRWHKKHYFNPYNQLIHKEN
jgi:hypothetical protein